MPEITSNTATLDIMKKSKTNFFYSSVFLPKDKSEALRIIYAFCRMTDDIADDNSCDTATKKKKLDDWKKRLDDTLNGAGNDAFFMELKNQIEKFNIPYKPFFDLIKGMEMDLEKKAFSTFNDLYEYCYCVASGVGLMSIEIFGYKNPCIREYAEYLGVALQLTNIMRDVAKDYEEGRIYIPKDELDKFGYTEDDLKKGVMNRNFTKLMEYQYNRAFEYFSAAEKCLPDEEKRNMVPAMIMGKVYYKILDKIKGRRYNIFGKKIRLSNLNKFSIAFGIFMRYRFLR